MSYVDVESERVSSRIILADHRIVTSAAQIQDNCKGVLLEGSFIKLDDFFNPLEKGVKSFLYSPHADKVQILYPRF